MLIQLYYARSGSCEFLILSIDILQFDCLVCFANRFINKEMEQVQVNKGICNKQEIGHKQERGGSIKVFRNEGNNLKI